MHKDGDITLYAAAVISKDTAGELQLKAGTERGAIGAATGLLAGSLIGAVGGPLGLVAGAATGTFAGLLFDMNSGDVNSDFAANVSRALMNGKTAVVAEIDETWTVPVDTRLAESNAIVFRRLKHEIAEDQLARESKAIATELKQLKEELSEAGEDSKVKIKSAVAKLEEKAQVVNDQLRKKLNDKRNEFDTKMRALHEQMKDVKEKRKVKMMKRIADLRDDYQTRAGKLKQAEQWLTKALDEKKKETTV